MATAVPTLVDGDDLTEDFTLAVEAAIEELQAAVPETSTTWSSPINTGITIGNGTVTANYCQIGPLVIAQFKFAQGSSGGVTGDIQLNLPVTAATPDNMFGSGWYNDSGGGVRYPAIIASLGYTTTVNLRALNAAGTYASQQILSTTVPFTWAAGDQVVAGFCYFAA